MNHTHIYFHADWDFTFITGNCFDSSTFCLELCSTIVHLLNFAVQSLSQIVHGLQKKLFRAIDHNTMIFYLCNKHIYEEH